MIRTNVQMLTLTLFGKKPKNARRKFSRRHPHVYREATLEYDNGEQYVHMDTFRRQYTGPEDDRYISPASGSIKKLIVQSTHSNSGNSTYHRTTIGTDGSCMVSLAHWALIRPRPTIFGWIYGVVKYILACSVIGPFVSGDVSYANLR